MRIAMIGQKGIGLGERGGGIERHVTELSRELSLLGHEVTVYARRRYGADGEVAAGVEVRYLPTIYRKHLEAIVHSFLATVDALFRPYDIVHYHGVGPGTLSWIPRLLKRRARVIVTFHAQDRFHDKWKRPARHYLHFGEWAACWFPHATICVSHVVQAYAREVYHRQLVYIPNGAELRTVTEDTLVRKIGLEPGRYFLSVGRLVPVKGHRYLIEAFNLARSRGELEGFQLAIVGSPSYTPEYERELFDLTKGTSGVRFLGFQTGDLLDQLYAHAYLYVQPSEREGLATAVLEAMGFGKAVLVSDIPENLEAMHQAGFSFKNKDVESLTDRLIELAHHPELVEEVARVTRDVVRREYSWKMIAAHTEELYRSVRH